MNFDELEEFKKDLKDLKRKYRSLDNDLETLKKALTDSPIGPGKHSAIIKKRSKCLIVKTRLACKSLLRKSMRVIYAYFASTRRIVFIQIYFKGDKETHDEARIQAYLKALGD